MINSTANSGFLIPTGEGFSRVPSTTDIESLIKKTRLDLNAEYKTPPHVLELNGIQIGSLDNFSLIIGKPKSKKTFLSSWIIASALKTNSNNPFKANFPENKKKVLLFDTEQAKFDVQKVSRRVFQINGDHFDKNLIVHTLRACSIEERLKIIQELIYREEGIGLVVIDGVRDLISAINDEKEASEIANKLMKWSEERNIHIVTVLHTNKNDDKARGHIGSELVNKAETTILLKASKKKITEVSAGYSRGLEFNKFAFIINAEGLPEVFKNYQPSDESGRSKVLTDPEDIDDQTHLSFLKLINEEGNEENCRYNNLVRLIKKIASDKSICIGDNKAKKWLTYYLDKGWIKKEGLSHSKNTRYIVNQEFIKSILNDH